MTRPVPPEETPTHLSKALPVSYKMETLTSNQGGNVQLLPYCWPHWGTLGLNIEVNQPESELPLGVVCSWHALRPFTQTSPPSVIPGYVATRARDMEAGVAKGITSVLEIDVGLADAAWLSRSGVDTIRKSAAPCLACAGLWLPIQLLTSGQPALSYLSEIQLRSIHSHLSGWEFSWR